MQVGSINSSYNNNIKYNDQKNVNFNGTVYASQKSLIELAKNKTNELIKDRCDLVSPEEKNAIFQQVVADIQKAITTVKEKYSPMVKMFADTLASPKALLLFFTDDCRPYPLYRDRLYSEMTDEELDEFGGYDDATLCKLIKDDAYVDKNRMKLAIDGTMENDSVRLHTEEAFLDEYIALAKNDFQTMRKIEDEDKYLVVKDEILPPHTVNKEECLYQTLFEKDVVDKYNTLLETQSWFDANKANFEMPKLQFFAKLENAIDLYKEKAEEVVVRVNQRWNQIQSVNIDGINFNNINELKKWS